MKNELSREDFNKLADLLRKMGYIGYFDFLQNLKDIANNIGANYFEKEWVGDDVDDLEGVKTIYEVERILRGWSYKISTWLDKHPEWINEILESEPALSKP